MTRLLTRENVKLMTVAVACLLVAWTGPSIAHGVHAKFAHNADKVDGKHAVSSGASLTSAKKKLVAHNNQGQLPAKFIPETSRNVVYRYEVPNFAPTTFHAMSFPGLPAGRYLATYSLSPQTTGNMDCGFFVVDHYEINGRDASTGAFAHVSATGVVDTRSTPAVLQCFGSANFNYSVSQAHYSTVTFLRIEGVADRSAGTAPRPATSRGGTGN